MPWLRAESKLNNLTIGTFYALSVFDNYVIILLMLKIY